MVDVLKNILSRLKVLPLLILLMAGSLTVRVSEFVVDIQNISPAIAADETMEVAENPPPLGADEGGDAKSDEGMIENKDDAMDSGSGDDLFGAMPVDLSGDTEFFDIQAKLYEELAERRRTIEKRERELAVKQALLDATQREIEQKMRELNAVRDEIKELLEKQDQQTDERIVSLVTIYEGMKAKDAARIFNTLDLDVLVTVLGAMSERKSGPILAAMEPERARTVTIMMVQQQQQMPTLAR